MQGIDTHQFGIAIHTAEGETVLAGKADATFTIQSISKIFSLTLRARNLSATRCGTGSARSLPGGDPYNSIVDLGTPEGHSPQPAESTQARSSSTTCCTRPAAMTMATTNVRDLMNSLLDGEEVGIDDEVAGSEGGSNFANRADGQSLQAFREFRKRHRAGAEGICRTSAPSRCQAAPSAGARRALSHGRTPPDSDDEKALRRARRVRTRERTDADLRAI